jgi:uncharacterized RDD family membrane protein YckC/Tfp pilus assembly major pilin PilA
VVNDVPGAADDRAAYAGFWRRVAAFAIDYVLALLGSAVLGAVAQITGLVGDSPQQLSLAVLAAYFLYYTLLESSRLQATIGKRALGLKVTDRHGERIGFARAAVRFVTKILSTLTLCLGFLLIVVTRRRQALHDLVAGTVVAHDGTPRRPAWVVAAVSAVACAPMLAVLAAIALPGYRDYTVRAQVSEGLDIASGYRAAIEAAWLEGPREFVDLNTDSVGPKRKGAGRYVESVEVVSGMIVITYGGAANDVLAGSVLTLVPALNAEDALAWACGYGDPPAGFESVFEGHAGYTDIEPRFIPSSCRSSEP